jgi:hypothetical protein
LWLPIPTYVIFRAMRQERKKKKEKEQAALCTTLLEGSTVREI